MKKDYKIKAWMITLAEKKRRGFDSDAEVYLRRRLAVSIWGEESITPVTITVHSKTPKAKRKKKS